MSAKKERFCSIADLRDLENETSTVFDVYSKDMRIKFRNYVFRLCYLITPEYRIKLLMNKLFKPNFGLFYKCSKSYKLTTIQESTRLLADYDFLIISIDEDTCFRQPARMNPVEAFLLDYGSRVFIMRNTLGSIDQSFFYAFPFSAVEMSLLILDRFWNSSSI